MRILLLLVAGGLGALAQENPREIVRQSVQAMDHNLVLARNYTFLERSETRELDSDGHPKTLKILQYDVTMLEGSPYRRLVGRDDHPLSKDETAAEEKKLQDSITLRRKETPAQRSKRIADYEKRRQREREPLDEVPDAFDFRIAGTEAIDGRDAWVIAASPHAGYRARSTLAKLFPKFRGKIWIDKADRQWVRVQAEVIDSISWGLFVARLSKGARLDVQMTRVNSEVWLPKRIQVKASARVALVKAYRIELDTTYSSYRKFQVESNVISSEPR